jgi:ABC-type transporter Mla subunit MlaD
MASRSVSRTNVIAGVFVLASAVLAVAISVWVSGAQENLKPRTRYVIRFPIEQGAHGIKAGSNVNLGGQKVGHVTRVEFFRPAGPGSVPQAVDVKVVIDADLQLYEDAVAFLERPLLGNIGAINIVNVGNGTQVAQPQNNSPLLQQDEVLPGTIAPPAFLAQAGYGPDQARQFRTMIQQAGEAVDRINQMTVRIDAQVDPTMKSIRTAADDIQGVTSSIREKADRWSGQIERVLGATEDASGQLKPLMERLDQVVANADATITDFRAALRDNRPALDRIIANIDQGAERLNRESVPLLNQTMTHARDGADEFGKAGRAFNALIQEESPNLRRILANLRLAADQIKLTGVEVRRNPWRLLYQPKTKELESELFYDAARTYAEAVSDLRAASESLQAVTVGGPGATEGQSAQEINAQLQDAFKRYQQAEQNLLDRMIKKGQ